MVIGHQSVFPQRMVFITKIGIYSYRCKYLSLPLKSWTNTEFFFEGDIYYTDTSEDVIRRSSPDGEKIETIIEKGLVEAGGIAIDSIGRKVKRNIQ